MISLKDKVTLITGASRGIGRAVALLFARAGSHVVINYASKAEDADEVKRLCLESGVRALAIKADVAVRKQVDDMVARTLTEFGKIDVLVNNAGIWVHNPIDQLSDARLKETVATNLFGHFYPIAAVVPHMKERRSGTIINLSSTAGQRGEAFYSPYAATKGAIISLTKSLASELAPWNIRVNCVAPGWVDTDMSHEALIGPDRESILDKIQKRRRQTLTHPA